ncbi:MAG: hypothetical protein IKB79_04955 [Oscillospiraceae bacterium]|nr:hypothetical protein [Oscillospiraceae bacterium]
MTTNVTTTTDILEAINLRLLKKWPQRTVYAEACPVDFDRPSFWLQVQSHDQADAGKFLLRHTVVILLTLFDELDEHYEASWQRLSRETDDAMYLLSPPLEAGGRHISLGLKRLPRDPDRAQLQLTAAWMDTMPGCDSNDIPVADSVELDTRVVLK